MNFIKFLKDNEGARKIFGKKELAIIEKQLSGQTLTQSEKNRLSRDIRPKLHFIDECSGFKEFFGLGKNMINKAIIEKSARTIADDDHTGRIDSVLLFGSFADGTFHQQSDIDIAVVFKAPMGVKEATQYRIRLMGQLNDKVDLQVFNALPLKVRGEIAQNHRILFKAKSFDNTNFILRCFKEFYDMRYRLAKVEA